MIYYFEPTEFSSCFSHACGLAVIFWNHAPPQRRMTLPPMTAINCQNYRVGPWKPLPLPHWSLSLS